MKHRRSCLAFFVSLVMSLSSPLTAAETSLVRLPAATETGLAISVRVPDQPLVFTGQVAAKDVSLPARQQARAALDALDEVLREAGSDLGFVVRLNACVANESAMPEVLAEIAARFSKKPIALTAAYSPTTVAGAAVVFDAVAGLAARPKAPRAGVLSPQIAILPEGGRVFISGQAERGKDLAEAVKLTMAGLNRTLTHLGLSAADVVQAKAFLKPFADHTAAQREYVASFGDRPAPPLVLVEWVSDLFVEIELVVALNPAAPKPAEALTYTTLPWLNKSPRYSHVCTVSAGTPLLFLGAVDGEAGDPRAQMKRIFERTGSALFEAGSSYRNLVKATYFLGDPATRALLGDIRGVYFDPARAPAASALGVRQLGVPGRVALIDLIAVPVK